MNFKIILLVLCLVLAVCSAGRRDRRGRKGKGGKGKQDKCKLNYDNIIFLKALGVFQNLEFYT